LALTGITCSDTRDESGAFRYIPDNPIREYRDPVKDERMGHKWHGVRGAHALVGMDAFSNETVALHLNYKIGTKWLDKLVHYSTDEIMYRYHDFFVGKCDEELLTHSPDATKIKYLGLSQKKRHYENVEAKIEEVLGFPKGHLTDKSNF